jgi:CRISPR-associated protein Cas2
MMLVVVVYDVRTESNAGQKRFRRVAKVCEDVGQRVQDSVFECLIDEAKWTKLRARLVEEADLSEDSLRFYILGDKWRHRMEHVGTKTTYDPQGPPAT